MTTCTGTATVQTEEHDGIFVITIDRPEARNAVDRLESRDDLRVGTLTGTDGVFNAGMDLKAFAAGDTPVVEGRSFAGITRARTTTPLIAAVEGYALGGGTEMALACDMIVATRDATFGQTEVHYDIVPPPKGAWCACPNASRATSPWNSLRSWCATPRWPWQPSNASSPNGPHFATRTPLSSRIGSSPRFWGPTTRRKAPEPSPRGVHPTGRAADPAPGLSKKVGGNNDWAVHRP